MATCARVNREMWRSLTAREWWAVAVVVLPLVVGRTPNRGRLQRICNLGRDEASGPETRR
jgi:hypothetical protein